MAFRFTGFADEASRSLDEQIEVTRQAGWSSIELRMIGDKNVCALEPAEWREVWDKLQKGGITVAGFGSALCNWSRPITNDFQVDLDDLRRAIPYMREANCNLIRIMSYPNDKNNPLPREEWRAEVIRRLKELCRIAEGEGIILGHENCNGYASQGPAEFLDIAEQLDSPAFKMIFDTGNTTGHDGKGYEGTWDFYERCRDFIVHVHIKSFRKNEEGKWKTCWPDEDPVQRKILQDLKNRGYDGWLSIEPHLAAAVHANVQSKDKDYSKRIYLEYTKRLENLVNSLD
ncbi:MAG: sugar phosphate isomerase/epimerase [Lentisphaerae bacterium]|nr:MAG: sugar phosphate isomerase/epimerase [Lentisphaerota bacterium]